MSVETSTTKGTTDVVNSLAAHLRKACLDVVWRQWAVVGGMASSKMRARSLVDPEALILMSLSLAEHERRLNELTADWVVGNADLVGVQRVNNLVPRYPPEVKERLRSLARIAFEEGKDHRWKSLAAGGASFSDRRVNRVRAIRTQAIEPAALLLRLRLAFGVGVKADVLGFLLGTEGAAFAPVRAIALATGYTAAAVRRAAENLTAAAFIQSMSDGVSYYGVNPRGWRALLEVQGKLPGWRHWNERFVFVAAFLLWSHNLRDRPYSAYVLETQARHLLDVHRNAFRWERVHDLSEPRKVNGIEALANAVTALAQWMLANA